MFLLDENKAMLLDITRSRAVEEVSWKTAGQLQSVEELRLPSACSRSSSTSPDRRDCLSEGEQGGGAGEEALRSASLDGLPEQEEPERRRKVSSACKLAQISRRVEEEEVVEEEQELVGPIAIRVTEVEEEQMPEETTEEGLATSPCPVSPLAASPSAVSPSSASPSTASPPTASSTAASPSAVSPEVPPRRKEAVGKAAGAEAAGASKRPEKRRRDDSLESNPASIKSAVQLSDTGSVLSHRFSTISISSNVSSDVSLGNTSAVSGSSCYLASMSSADFDDRPPLASSFSLSEAEEEREREEEREEGAGGSKDAASPPKKDQLSPPKGNGSSKQLLLSGRGERPKLKSVFKRTSEGRSKSHSSSEGRSREGEAECLAVKGARSSISTLSSMTPDTSLEQSTCVERCSSSFEEELLRSQAHEEEPAEDNAFSASDSDDSAEAGGNLTHHRSAGRWSFHRASISSIILSFLCTIPRYYHVFREGEIDHMIEKYGASHSHTLTPIYLPFPFLHIFPVRSIILTFILCFFLSCLLQSLNLFHPLQPHTDHTAL